MTDVDGVVQSIRDGKLAVLPTDTVYGLVCAASHREPAADLYRLKGRAAIQPTAVVFGAVGVLRTISPSSTAGCWRSWRSSCPGRTRSSSRIRRTASRG